MRQDKVRGADGINILTS